MKFTDDSSLKRLQEEKILLEIEKLRNEISLQKKPLKNPVNWPAFATMVAASFAIIWAMSTGWYTNQNDKLEIRNFHLETQKQELESAIRLFSIEKKDIEDSISVLRRTIQVQGKVLNDPYFIWGGTLMHSLFDSTAK